MSGRERVRAILAFREELSTLTDEGVVQPDDPTLTAIANRHATVLAEAAADEGVDLSRAEAQLSAGMRLATLLGAMALSTAWAMFVSSIWDDIGAGAQLALVWLPPMLLVAGTEWSARREATGYVANILATVGAIAVVVATIATVRLYSWQDGRWQFLVVGGYALFLAYRHRLVMPFLIGATATGAWVWSLAALLRGERYDQVFEVAEPAIVVGLMAIAFGVRRRSDPPEFRWVWRVGGVVAVAWSLLVLGVAGEASWFGPGVLVEGVYQLLAPIVFVAMVWFGLRTDDAVLARGGGVALVLYLVFRMFDWFWEAIPNWLFFLLIGALAFGALLALKHVRRIRRTAG